jgi:hypothetical protein
MCDVTFPARVMCVCVCVCVSCIRPAYAATSRTLRYDRRYHSIRYSQQLTRCVEYGPIDRLIISQIVRIFPHFMEP